MTAPRITDIEIVEDRTEGSLADEGFLRIRRLTVQNRHEDGSTGEPYACDVMSRRNVDAVAVILYEISDDADERTIHVVLKSGMRPAVQLRRDKQLVVPDEHDWLHFVEMCAGVLEEEDTGTDAIERRAVAEAAEECGVPVDEYDVRPLGGPSFPSPGVTDEKVFFASAVVRLADAGEVVGDGSGMEQGTERVVVEIREAIARCRDGRIPDMKTELALLRLCDQIGYVPQFGLFVDELPGDLAERYAPPGIEPAGMDPA